MPRKTAAQKAKAAARATSAITPDDPESLHNGLNGADGQPKQKKMKMTYESTAGLGSLSKAAGATVEISSELTETPILRRQPGQVRMPPSAPPKSVPGNTTILPPEADNPKLRSQCDVHGIRIAVGSKMEDKVRHVLQALQSSKDGGKGAIAALTSATKAANKCIGVAEIAKRELVKDGMVRVYQYTGCWTRLETQDLQAHDKACPTIGKSNGAKNWTGDGLRDDATDGQAKEAENSDDAFEEMSIAERKKVRNAVCLIIYLSLEPIGRLRELYGEQIHELDKR
jgi:hypothetical protein